MRFCEFVKEYSEFTVLI